MTRTARKHLPALDEQAREEAGVELQATLVELVALSLTGKQLHWSVRNALPADPPVSG